MIRKSIVNELSSNVFRSALRGHQLTRSTRTGVTAGMRVRNYSQPISNKISNEMENPKTKQALNDTTSDIKIRGLEDFGLHQIITQEQMMNLRGAFGSATNNMLGEGKISSKLRNTIHQILEKIIKMKSAVAESKVVEMSGKTAANAAKKYWNDENIEAAKTIGLAIAYGVWGILSGLATACIPRRFRYKSVAGQVILITGGGSGIGRLMARSFALEHGATVISWDINPEGNAATAHEINQYRGYIHTYEVDVTNREAVYKAAKEVMKDIGKVDIIINNAGLINGKRFVDTSDEEIIRLFDVNTFANFWVTKAFLPDMIRTGRGHIVTISSLAGLMGINQLVDYSSSKFAAVGFHEALRNELQCDERSQCVHMTLVCPYYIHTGLFHGVHSKIIPILRPEPVAEDIVAGILSNQGTIVIPRYTYLLILLKNIVPAEVSRRLSSALGISTTMTSFVGRSGVGRKR